MKFGAIFLFCAVLAGAPTFGDVLVDGVVYPFTNAGIQAAVNATPLGGTVRLGTGTYLLTGSGAEEIKITKAINFICSGWGTNLQLASSVPKSTILLHIVPSGAVFGVRIQDCAFRTQAGTPGSYAIQVDTSSGNTLFLFVIDHIEIAGTFGTGGIWLNNTGGEANGGILDGIIENSYINGGILCTLCGDSLNITRNLIQDAGSQSTIGVDANFIMGASSLRITDNTINPNGAAIHIGASAIFTQITGNEFEPQSPSATGSNGAFVDIDGTVRSPGRAVDISNNSFQIINGSTLNGLRINYAARTNVSDNFFQRGTGDRAKDIVVTANAVHTRIRSNNFYGDTIANALSDSAPLGQTLYEFGNDIGGGVDSGVPLIYKDSSNAVTIAGGGVAASSLGTVLAAGTQKYCTDCKVAAICTGGGTGHMAVSNGTNWTCQ